MLRQHYPTHATRQWNMVTPTTVQLNSDANKFPMKNFNVERPEPGNNDKGGMATIANECPPLAAATIQEMKSQITIPANDNRPHIAVTVNGHSITGLLDSGANVTMLGKGTERLVETLTLRRSKYPMSIRTADGTHHEAPHVADVPYTVNGETRTVETLVMPSIKTPLILGTDFWRAFGIWPMMCCMAESDDEKPEKFDPVNVRHALTSDQQDQLKAIVESFNTASKDGILGHTKLTTHHIDTGDAEPIKQRPHLVSPYIQKGIHEEVDRLLAKGIITKVENPTWLNPIVPAKKKNGKIRICLDARKLNGVTKKCSYPQPNANRILGLLNGTKYLSAIDLTDAFYQIKLDEESQRKTAFAVTSRGTYMYTRMPMGLCNSSATISALVESVFGSELEPWAFHFIDDFIVATDTFEQHMEILSKVAEKLRLAGLQISADKSRFCMSRLVFLGYVIDANGIQPDPERIRPIVEFAQPKCVKDVRRLIGMASWYRRFIENFSAITTPISNLIRKDKAKFEWTEEAEKAFEALKSALVSAPILATPDFTLPFTIECDASDVGIGAVLTQQQDGQERVIAYMSAKLNSAQRKYHVTERECLAVLTAIEKFRQYIEGTKFTVITDHASLLWLQNLKDPVGRLARWALRLQAHDYEIKHRKGRYMVVPDALSRSVEAIQLQSLEATTDQDYIDLRIAIARQPANFNGLRLDGQIILKQMGQHSAVNDDGWRIYVPADFRAQVLHQHHNEKLAAHGGYMKTICRLRERYYWPKMQRDTAKYVSDCEICRATKATNQCQTAPMGKYRDPERPWKMISLDFMGPFPSSRGRNRQLLVVIDAFSKFVLMKPMRAASAEATTEFLRTEVFMKFGVPAVLVSDNGPQLRSKHFREFLEKYSVKHWRVANYHPQPNATEAANKTILNAVRAYIEDDSQQRDWDAHLAEIGCALNSAVHTSTNFAPYTVIYGYNMCTDGNDHLPVDVAQRPNNMTLERIREQVARNLRAAYEKNKRRYDTRTREIKYDVGDTVWKVHNSLSNAGQYYSSKLADRYVKCKIVAKTGSNTYRLSDMNGRDLGIYSTKDLKAA